MAITKDIYNSPTVKESIKIAKNNAEIDAHIGLEQLYQEALENGFKGSKDDFIRTAPLKLLRQIMKNGGEVKENSYQQLIDDYDNNIEVIKINGEKESLTNYIKRMGGIDLD